MSSSRRLQAGKVIVQAQAGWVNVARGASVSAHVQPDMKLDLTEPD